MGYEFLEAVRRRPLRVLGGPTLMTLLLLVIADAGAQPRSGPTAERNDEPYIVVSIEERRLWLIQGQDTILSASAAVGRDETVVLNDETFHFATPRGTRRVLAKERDPVWVPPNWHYYEKAEALNLEVVAIERGERYELLDGSTIKVRDDQVGRVNQYGNFWAFTPGMEIIFDGKLFMPPFGTEQRRIPNALGAFKLDLGDGYLIHGTHRYTQDSIGLAVSHGCVRLDDEDLEHLYRHVEVGTPVYIR